MIDVTQGCIRRYINHIPVAFVNNDFKKNWQNIFGLVWIQLLVHGWCTLVFQLYFILDHVFFHALFYQFLILVDRHLLRTCFVDVRNEYQRYPDKRGELRCGPPVLRPAVTAMNTHNTGDNIHWYNIRHNDFLFKFSLGNTRQCNTTRYWYNANMMIGLIASSYHKGTLNNLELFTTIDLELNIELPLKGVSLREVINSTREKKTNDT